MPPKTSQRRPISKARGSDPTVSIASASTARTAFTSNSNEEQNTKQPDNEQATQQKANDDLKKLIETLKNKLGNNTASPPQKEAPPSPKPKTAWNRSIASKETKWAPKPAYTVLSRVSNHEKVPTAKRATDPTINSLPHSFLYKPGADGIKVDKLNIKAGKQLGIG